MKVPGHTPLYFCAFFALAVVVSQAAHVLLAYEPWARQVACMGMLFSLYIFLALALAGVSLQLQTTTTTVISEIFNYTLFFTLLAAASTRPPSPGEPTLSTNESNRLGGPRWLILQLVLFTAWSLALGLGNHASWLNGGDAAGLSPFQPVWETTIEILYWVASGLIRLGALVECETVLAQCPKERWLFRFLILINIAMWMSSLALSTTLTSYGANSLDATILLAQSIIIVVYCIT